MKLEQALEMGRAVLEKLGPHCERIELAGSARRQKAEPGDVEMVCIPKTFDSGDLFGAGEPHRDPDFIAAARELGTICKGCLRTGKFMQFRVAGEQLDLFTATPENWGLILAIRTGSADFSHKCLATGWVKAGYTSIEGMLHRRGVEPVPVREEADLFKLIGLPWIPPERRG